VLVAHAYNPSYSQAEIRRILVQSQHGQIICETLSRKNPLQKRAGRVAQDIGPEFKLHHGKKKKKKKMWSHAKIKFVTM
jgi:hypothetical protein